MICSSFHPSEGVEKQLHKLGRVDIAVQYILSGFQEWKPDKGIAMETSYGHNQLTINSNNCKDKERGALIWL